MNQSLKNTRVPTELYRRTMRVGWTTSDTMFSGKEKTTRTEYDYSCAEIGLVARCITLWYYAKAARYNARELPVDDARSRLQNGGVKKSNIRPRTGCLSRHVNYDGVFFISFFIFFIHHGSRKGLCIFPMLIIRIRLHADLRDRIPGHAFVLGNIPICDPAGTRNYWTNKKLLHIFLFLFLFFIYIMYTRIDPGEKWK